MADAPSEKITPTQFIRELWSIAPADWIVEFNLLQYRPTQENPNDLRMRAIFYTVKQVLDDWGPVEENLRLHNRNQVENIHHGVNPRFRKPKKHGTNADVSHYVAAWVDVDFHGHEEAVRKQFFDIVMDFQKRALDPSIIVESGRGLHAYWLFDKPYPKELARPICAGIQDYFKISDPVHDPRRILRMPGFLNLKNPKDPKICSVFDATWTRYPIERFKDFSITDFKKSGEDLEIEEEERSVSSLTSLKSRDPKLQEALSKGVDESGGPHGGRHLSATAVVGYFCRFSKTKKVASVNSENWNKKLCRPPLPDEEIERMVEDFWAKEEVRRSEVREERKILKEKERELKGPDDGPPWWRDDEFLPEELARYICSQHKIMATPIGDDYKGVTLYVYKDGAYRSRLGSSIETEVRDALARDAKPDRINQVLDLIHRSQKIDYEEINPRACELINVQNGMLDWKTGELSPHDPKYLSTIQISAEYQPDAKCEALDKFFTDVFPPDCVALAEEFVGYLLIPDTRLQKAFIAVGAGGNGKGTFLKILTSLLGKENVSTMDIHTLEDDKFATAALVGKLANVHHDLSRKQLESTSRFKTLVSGDPISGEKKFKDGFTFRPFARLVFSANEFPRSEDKTNAYFRRLIFVEFPNSFSGAASEILDYDRVLAKTPGFMSALLNRGVSGLRRVINSGRFSVSETSTRTIEQYKRECNSAYDFVQEYCHLEEWGWIPRQNMYQKYHGWCQDNGLKPMSSKNFVNGIRDTKGIKEVKREGVRGWLGISWTNGNGPKTSAEEVQAFGDQKAVGNDF
jgi:P4 family phage/plasmid primase-like protien